MATVTQIASGRWVADAATVWSTGLVPAEDDIVQSAGWDLAVDDDTNAVASFSSSVAGVLAIDSTKTLTAKGSVSLGASSIGGTGTIACGGSLSVSGNFIAAVNIEMTGTGTFTDDSASPGGANLEINSSGTVTLATDVTCVDFLLSTGTLAESGFVVHALGDVERVDGTHGGTLVVYCDGSGALAWTGGGGSLTRALRKIYLATTGNTYTLTGNVQSQEIICRGGNTTGLFALSALVTADSLNTFWQQGPECPSPSVEWVQWHLLINSDAATVAYADVSGIDTELVITSTNAQGTITVLGELNAHAARLVVESRADGDANTLVATSAITAGMVQLGETAAVNRSGILTVNGMASFESIADGNAANLANGFNFGPGSHVEYSGLADFANVAVTASTNMPPEIVCGPGGKVTNCEPDNEIALFGDANVNDTPGTNNLNITNFVNNQSYPGSLMTMGIGGGRLLVPFLLMGMGICSMMMKGMC